MRRILYWLGLVDLVWTVDFDQEIRLRIVRYTNNAQRCFVNGHMRNRLVELNIDGTVTPVDKDRSNYVRKWTHYSEKPNNSNKLSMFRHKNAFRIWQTAERLK